MILILSKLKKNYNKTRKFSYHKFNKNNKYCSNNNRNCKNKRLVNNSSFQVNLIF